MSKSFSMKGTAGGASDNTKKPFSLAFGASKPQSVLPSKRPRAALTEDSEHEDDDGDGERTSGPQAVSGFDDSGAVRADAVPKPQRKEPLVIPVKKDADWRDPSRFRRKGKNLLPPEAQARINAKSGQHGQGQEAEKEQATQYGLVIINSRKPDEGSSDGDTKMDVDGEAPRASEKEQAPTPTLDEEAYARLVNGKEEKSSLVIPGADDADQESGWMGRNEGDNFRADVASRPESSTVADYETVPIEEFGAAMLRGMGWKEGEAVGRGSKGAKESKPKTLERRPNLLGIGAKHAPEGLEEMGAWGKGVKDGKGARKGPKTRETYNPVVMRNSKTGEMLTEEELKERQKKQAEAAQDAEWKADDRDRKERRDRDRYDDRDRDRDRYRRRKDEERDRDRRRKGEEYDDREYKRRDDRDSRHSRRRSRSPRRRSRSRDYEKPSRRRHHDDDRGDRSERHSARY